MRGTLVSYVVLVSREIADVSAQSAFDHRDRSFPFRLLMESVTVITRQPQILGKIILSARPRAESTGELCGKQRLG